jgi:phospholipid N-methyltransferase
VAPSSRYLAAALVRPFSERTCPATVLEIGAGTGRVTTRLIDLLGPEDHLDVCEIQPSLADLIESRVMSTPHARAARARGRLRLLRCPAQDIVDPHGYDFIISGLPFTAFGPELVQTILDAVQRNLRPDGVFSYFEYLVLRRLNRSFALGGSRRRIRAVSAILDRYIRDHQFSRETVLLNIPPAYARHWRFAERDED